MSNQPATVRLAVIDTDSGFVRVLSNRVESAGWQYRVMTSAPRPDALIAMKLNAVVVDLSVLGPASWDFLERVSDLIPGLGLIVCTQSSTVAQRVRGLRLGADDWVTKPCHPEEVMARVEAVVRRRWRAQSKSDEATKIAGELEIRPDQFQVFVGGESVNLTRREFELLSLLSDARGRVMERDEIYQRVWGYAMAHGDRSVDVFIRKLRAKLQQASPDWDYIHTHFGVGYRFDPTSEHGVEPELAPAGGGELQDVGGPLGDPVADGDIAAIDGRELDDLGLPASV